MIYNILSDILLQALPTMSAMIGSLFLVYTAADSAATMIKKMYNKSRSPSADFKPDEEEKREQPKQAGMTRQVSI
jgi:hypothetical protein